MTLSAALETTDLRPESRIDCHGGVLRLPGRVIHDSHAGMGVVPMATVLARSSNIGAIEVGMRVARSTCMSTCAASVRPQNGIQLPANRPAIAQAVPVGQDVAGFHLHGSGGQRDHRATGASRLGDRERRPAGQAALILKQGDKADSSRAGRARG